MKRPMIITLMAGLGIAAAAGMCLFGGQVCAPESCGKEEVQAIGNPMTCGNCGKTSCGKICAHGGAPASPAEAAPAAKMLPSCLLADTAQRMRGEHLKADVFARAKRIDELPEGFEFVFEEPIAFSQSLIELVNFERVCCPSFTWALVFEPENLATKLQVYGSPAIKAELRSGLREMKLL